MFVCVPKHNEAFRELKRLCISTESLRFYDFRKYTIAVVLLDSIEPLGFDNLLYVKHVTHFYFLL